MQKNRLANELLWAAGCMLTACVTSASDWPRFLGPQASGVSSEDGLNTAWVRTPPPARWKIAMHDRGYAGPCAARGTVFIVDHIGDDDVVRAVDLEAGQDRWRFSYPAPATDTYGASRSTPAYDEGRLYTVSRDGLLHCLDATSGGLLWKRDLIRQDAGRLAFYRMAASPVIDGQRLIVCPGGASGVIALDKTTGALVWKSPNGDPEGHATPVVASLRGIKQYLVFTGRNLLGLSPTDGRILWRFPWATDEGMNAANPVVIGGDLILISSCDNGTALLGLAGGQVREVWRNRELRVYFGTPLVHDGLIFAKDDSQALMCLDLATGAVLWRQAGMGARWLDNGGLLVGHALIVPDGRTGDVHVVAAERGGYRSLGLLPSPAGRDSLVAPILADGRLILRSTTALVCLDLRRSPRP